MKITVCRGGFALVTVLFVTAIGLLFGAGALLLFRYQCQLRIERQHELEKVYAVRSALNYIRKCADQIADAGTSFQYHGASDRDLNLLVKPVDPIFPNTNRVARKHFAMELGTFDIVRASAAKGMSPGFYDDDYDYECGTIGCTNLLVSNAAGLDLGLAFDDLIATNGVRWWVNIGMRDTGGWAQEDFGRRYYFLPLNFTSGATVKDVARLCIVRNVTNRFNSTGRQHGWPLSKVNERAVVFEVRPLVGNGLTDKNNATMTLSEYVHVGSDVEQTVLHRWTTCPSLRYMGLQIAQNKVSVFYLENIEVSKISSGGYTFLDAVESTTDLDCVELTRETYDYFVEEQVIDGVWYAGTNTVDGQLKAPELRAVFEVEAVSDRRRKTEEDVGGLTSSDGYNFITKFKVTPAYQYDVFIEHSYDITNRATVAQRIKRGDGRNANYTTLTYDTHGTENRGFRKDEREAERRRNGQ